jgi:hypothetical protein
LKKALTGRKPPIKKPIIVTLAPSKAVSNVTAINYNQKEAVPRQLRVTEIGKPIR